MYQSNQHYLYIKKKELCNKKNTNTTAYPTRILDLQGVPTLQKNNPVTSPTSIIPTSTLYDTTSTLYDTTSNNTFYELYTIDPSGALFGQSTYPCNINEWKKYVTVVYKKCHK
jgi:hypothetical protein